MLRSAVFALLLAVSAPAFATQAPLIERDRVELFAPAGKAPSEAEVRSAIVAGGSQLGWVVAGEKPGELTLRYNKQDRHEVTIKVTYDAAGYLIRYVDSKNMRFESTSDKGKLIHNNYNRWTANLIKYVGQAYGKPAPQ